MKESSVDDICKELDSLTLRKLELMEDKIKATVQLEMLMRSGYIDLAKSRYICGKESISKLKIPVNSNMTTLFDLETKVEDENGKEKPLFDISLKKVTENESELQDPIKWFGVLVPQNLRTAQKRFQESVLLATMTANIQSEITSVQHNIDQLMIKKKMLSI